MRAPRVAELGSDEGAEETGPWRNVPILTPEDTGFLSAEFEENFDGVVLRVQPHPLDAPERAPFVLEATRSFHIRWLVLRTGLPIAFELWVHRGRITPHVWCPWELESRVRRALTAAYPRCAIERSGTLFHAVYPGERAAGTAFHPLLDYLRPFPTEFKADLLDVLLAALVPSDDIHHILFQVRIEPAVWRADGRARRMADRLRGLHRPADSRGRRPSSRDIARAERVETERIGERLYRTTVRALVLGRSSRVLEALNNIEAALGLFRCPVTGNGLRARKVPRSKVVEFIAAMATRDGRRFRSRGLRLNARELAGLVHLPHGESNPAPVEWNLDRPTPAAE